MHAELRPGQDLEQLLERPDAARQRDEAVRQLGHQRLALVHRADDAQLGQPAVGRARGRPAPGGSRRSPRRRGQRRVGEHAHQPDPPAAVDQADAARGQRRPPPRRPPRRRAGAGARAAEDADALHTGSSVVVAQKRTGRLSVPCLPAWSSTTGPAGSSWGSSAAGARRAPFAGVPAARRGRSGCPRRSPGACCARGARPAHPDARTTGAGRGSLRRPTSRTRAPAAARSWSTTARVARRASA